MFPFGALKQKEKNQNPITIGLVGAGYIGAGLIRQVMLTPGMRIAVVSNRSPEKAVQALLQAGIDSSVIRVCTSIEDAKKALREGRYVVTGIDMLPHEFPQIDVVVEATGNIPFGVKVTMAAIDAGKHIIAANVEAQATVGAALKRRADKAGVVYSDIDGDQPGILKALCEYCEGLGFRTQVAGNCKGVMKRYATPATQKSFAETYGIQPWIATAAADGTKINLEMCLVSNATGIKPKKTGMTGIQTSLDTLIDDCEKAGLLSGPPAVDFTLGISNGVFVIAHSEDKHVREELRYLKMGYGPFYVFHRPRVLCHYDAVPSIAAMVISGEPVVAPNGNAITEVVAFAKQNLDRFQKLDGIGGYDCYGLLMDGQEVSGRNLLPVGLSEFARVNRRLSKDEPICLDDIEWTEENEVLNLWRQQREMAKKEHEKPKEHPAPVAVQ